jgi:hypothetical protein
LIAYPEAHGSLPVLHRRYLTEEAAPCSRRTAPGRRTKEKKKHKRRPASYDRLQIGLGFSESSHYQRVNCVFLKKEENPVDKDQG